MKKITGLLLSAAMLLTVLLSGCDQNRQQREHDIIILFTNDVHCGVDDNIGYAGLAAYKSMLLEKTPHVILADCGDAVQGDVIGVVSQGEYLVEIMNEVGYDLAILGNHEFDYGTERLTELMAASEAEYLGCNIRYSGSGENPLSALAPYKILSFEGTDVAFIGVTAPYTLVSSNPANFRDENGELIYDFYGGSGEELYGQVQLTVDQCRKEGADYVILLTHLGDEDSVEPFRSTDLIANTTGINAVLDGHSHSVIPCDLLKNKNGETVLLSSTGTKLNYIGQLTLTAEGYITTGLISDLPDRDGDTQGFIGGIQSEYQEELDKVIGHSDVSLSAYSESGLRLVRNRETNLGDFCADAYRAVGEADIAIVNGGGIRADLAAGDISYSGLIAMNPYGNTLCVVTATGQQVLDALEAASRFTMAEADDGANAVGENGGFLQVSGLRYTIDTSVDSTVETDDSGMFLSCGENRRVKDVQVLMPDGTYAPIDPSGVYTVASHNFLIKSGGDGLNMFMEDELLMDEGMLDYQVLIAYVTDFLGGTVDSVYSEPQGRITVI